MKPLDYCNTPEVELTASEKFRVQCFLPVIDQYNMSLSKRISAYQELREIFGFLQNLDTINSEQAKKNAEVVCKIYPEDLEDSLGVELVHYSEFLKLYIHEKPDDMSKEHFMLKVLIEKPVRNSFPNVEILLRMYMSIMTTNCSGERAFSKLKLIKDRLSTTMTQENLRTGQF